MEKASEEFSQQQLSDTELSSSQPDLKKSALHKEEDLPQQIVKIPLEEYQEIPNSSRNSDSSERTISTQFSSIQRRLHQADSQLMFSLSQLQQQKVVVDTLKNQVCG